MSTIVQRTTSGRRSTSRSVAPSPPPRIRISSRRSSGQRRMNQALVVNAFVGLRALRIAVEHEHLAECRRTNHRDVLEFRPSGIVGLLDRMMVRLRWSELLNVPLPVFGFRHMFASGR
jgi:hypothetical protein